ncbi:hypothetical protein V5O48_010912 [Marasmius crinis-equi]|uniref:Uncharacterized protein n=1 Tax=Marasmius crinis-equi TaxID=585013 RepID=A0ABR3F713_9AGAR
MYNPYAAVLFDVLHFMNGGIWGDHMFPQLKKHVSKIGRAAKVDLDNRFDKMPPWRGLNHFNGVTTVSFNNGSHHRDISKIFLFAVHSVITEANNKAAYHVVKALQKYLNLYMYSLLNVQTADTISLGREALTEFYHSLQCYKQFCFDNPDLGKETWNFIKLHYLSHFFDNIEQKGAQHNFNTLLCKIYKLMTNFRDIRKQILWIEHQCLVAGIIRGQLDALDKLLHN